MQVPEKGGGTSFSKANLFVKPQKGMATFFAYKGADEFMDTGFTGAYIHSHILSATLLDMHAMLSLLPSSSTSQPLLPKCSDIPLFSCPTTHRAQRLPHPRGREVDLHCVDAPGCGR